MVYAAVAAGILIAIALIGHFGLPDFRAMRPYQEKHPVLDEAEPWRFQGNSDVAFLVVHGFTGSPFNTKPLGELFHSMGHTAVGIRLPGHGTHPTDMIRTRWQHYYEQVSRTYRNLKSHYNRVFLVGFSMGGTLCLDLAGRNAKVSPPAGLILISSPVFFNGFFNGRFIFHAPILTISGLLKIFINIVKLSSEIPETALAINPWVGYRFTYPVAALHSFKRAMPAIRRRLSKIKAPACLVMSENDETVNSANLHYIFSKLSSVEKRACMFYLPPDGTSRHVLPTHRFARQKVTRFIEDFVQDSVEDTDDKTTPGFRDRFRTAMRRIWPFGSSSGTSNRLQA